MNVIPVPSGRTSDMLTSMMTLNNLQSNQSQIAVLQQQLSSGQQLSAPSDNPVAAAGIEQLNSQLAAGTQYTTNLNYANAFLGTADTAMGNLNTLLNQAQQIASAQVGSTSNATQRSAAASQVGTLISQALSLANSTYQNAYVFSGTNGTQPAFATNAGGYVYQGSTQNQGIVTNTGSTLNYTVNGNDVFGGLSAQVTGSQNLSPALAATTPLSTITGPTGGPITPGPLTITSGGHSVTVDLTSAATMGDVQSMLQNALTGAGMGITVSLSGGHLAFANPSASMTISDVGSDGAASGLGIAGTAAAGAGLNGANLTSQITATTPLSALRNGAGVDPSGLVISNGTATATVGLAGLQTVGDLLNAINASGTHVQATINAGGTGINIQNPVSGTSMTISENGGSTAQQLGLLSLQGQTPLSSLNNGAGVTPISQTASGPSGTIVVTKTNGSTFTVSMNGITNSTQLAAAINSASGNGSVTAAVDPNSNALTLTDSSGGGGNLTVAAGTDYVSNGSQLGLFKTGTGNTLSGSAVNFSTDDFQVTRRDGSSFTVNVTGANTVQDVLNAINTAPGNTGSEHVAAALNAAGTGLTLTDPSTGPGALGVAALNGSSVAASLGIQQTASGTSPGQINGANIDGVAPTGVFAGLLALQAALAANNPQGITEAAGLLKSAGAQVTAQNGLVGSRLQDIQTRQTELSAQTLQQQSALSLLKDTNMTAAITQFQQVQTAYQASLQTAQTINSMSILTYLK